MKETLSQNYLEVLFFFFLGFHEKKKGKLISHYLLHCKPVKYSSTKYKRETIDNYEAGILLQLTL